jgi:tight adherence protein B
LTMPTGLLLPTLGLVGVLVAALVVLRLETRREQLADRVDGLSALGGTSDPTAELRRSIRLAQPRTALIIRWLSRTLGIPTDVDIARKVHRWLVFTIGALTAIADTVVGRLYFALPIAVIGGVVTGLMIVRAIFRWQFARYVFKLRQQLPDAIELLVSTTSAGLPVSEGFRAIAREMPDPTGQQFRRLVEEVALGTSVDVALRGLHHRTRVAEYAILSVTLAVQSRSGGRLAETISTLADTIRQRMALVARAGALAGEAKLSAIVMGILPILAGIMISVTQPGYLQPLFQDARGQRLLFIGIITLAAGALVMRQMIRSSVRE